MLKPGREKPVINQHPWVFSGAIDTVMGDPAPGALVDVVTASNRWLARGYWNARSQIQVRILTWQDDPIDADWWRTMIRRAVEARQPYLSAQLADGFRLINAESDFLPGLIVDCYGGWVVVQALTLHIDQRKQQIAHYLVDVLTELDYPPRGIYERSDVDVRRKEGLSQATGVLWGEEPPPLIQIDGENWRHLVDVRRGHKTGAYLDQRDNRAYLAHFMALNGLTDPAARLLNLFSYTGGFGAGIDAQVVNVDASYEALDLAEQIAQMNHVPAARREFVQADVFDLIRDFAEQGELFDVIVCDPPKFAHNQGQVERAARGYKDLNLHCFKCLQPGGYLMTYSCSGAISPDLFQKIVFGALADSGRQAQIVKHLGPGDDHPVALTFPEGEYLKGLLLRVY
ncbi:MAG: class I SAM-dependent rRNA methyltransferase [Chloroflexi bacterium]|nr:class I SAM-dependent rRNA methyltransferase [Chloroflexota bacterium]